MLRTLLCSGFSAYFFKDQPLSFSTGMHNNTMLRRLAQSPDRVWASSAPKQTPEPEPCTLTNSVFRCSACSLSSHCTLWPWHASSVQGVPALKFRLNCAGLGAWMLGFQHYGGGGGGGGTSFEVRAERFVELPRGDVLPTIFRAVQVLEARAHRFQGCWDMTKRVCMSLHGLHESSRPHASC